LLNNNLILTIKKILTHETFMHKSAFLFCLALTPVFSKTTPQAKPEDSVSRVYVGGYGGYGQIDGMYSNNGQYAQYRFTFGVDGYRCPKWVIGFEAGVQSGTLAQASASQADISTAGGLNPEAYLTPLIDALAVIRWNFVKNYSLIMKGGLAYRQLQLTDRYSSKDMIQYVYGEFQGGFGYQLTKHARIVALYQGIFSKNSLGLTLNSNNDFIVNHIPTQQAGLFGVEYHF
jgi:hypothetical protein